MFSLVTCDVTFLGHRFLSPQCPFFFFLKIGLPLAAVSVFTISYMYVIQHKSDDGREGLLGKIMCMHKAGGCC